MSFLGKTVTDTLVKTKENEMKRVIFFNGVFYISENIKSVKVQLLFPSTSSCNKNFSTEENGGLPVGKYIAEKIYEDSGVTYATIIGPDKDKYETETMNLWLFPIREYGKMRKILTEEEFYCVELELMIDKYRKEEKLGPNDSIIGDIPETNYDLYQFIKYLARNSSYAKRFKDEVNSLRYAMQTATIDYGR